MEHELLVHITAPSSRADDRRYDAIAREIVNFRPAIFFKVSGPGLDSLSSTSDEELRDADDDDVFVDTR